ncbi:hypothetical protein [Chryseobacterium lathyri]|uniref:hypothetical protein n=1 Tax=Chryseobacterium lathyri TaxID=395933 RepID=UPI002781FBBC|nr:hypothetical protein [Chryseobacterium lathyri]MDQ0065273.1 hypothetical protein [Chryseobacterium lathyri]
MKNRDKQANILEIILSPSFIVPSSKRFKASYLSEAYRLSHQTEKAIKSLKIYLTKEPTDMEAKAQYEN